MSPILVTRPSPDGEALCQLLEARGRRALHCPVMRIDLNEVPAPALATAEVLALTSANGARAWTARGGVPGAAAFCVGPATAAAAKAAGLHVEGVATGDVESLTSLLAARGVKRVLHVRGEHAAGDMVRSLRGHGMAARATALYRATRLNDLPQAAIAQLSEGPTVIALFSPRTVRLFGEALDTAGRAETLGMATAACLSPQVADAARDLPFRTVMSADAPEQGHLVDMILSRCP